MFNSLIEFWLSKMNERSPELELQISTIHLQKSVIHILEIQNVVVGILNKKPHTNKWPRVTCFGFVCLFCTHFINPSLDISIQ